MSNTATDLAGNALAQASSVGGKYRLVRQNTVALYSDGAKNLPAAYIPKDNAFSDTYNFGAANGYTGQRTNPFEIDRTFLQFPLKNLEDLDGITKINSAKLKITTTDAVNHPEDLGKVLIDEISTPLYSLKSALWFAPLVNVDQSNNVLSDPFSTGVHELDVTSAFAATVKNPVQFYGLSQWRIKITDETNHNDFKIVGFALGANKDITKRPYIQVTYEYP